MSWRSSALRLENAVQFFYAYLTIHDVARDRPAVHRLLNRAPLFWNTNLGALQTGSFIVLGRIFDQTSRHNVNRLASRPGARQGSCRASYSAGSAPKSAEVKNVKGRAIRQPLQIVQARGQGLQVRVRKRRDRCARLATDVKFLGAVLRDLREAIASDDARPAVPC